MTLKMKKWLRPAIFIAAGAIVGLLYYTFFGCTTGCPITSNPWLTMGYTAFIGWLVAGITAKDEKTERED